MSHDLTTLNPIVQELIGKVKPEISNGDFELLKTVSIKDVAQFFESVAQEKDDKVRYQKLLAWLQNREQAKIDAKLAAERKVREAEEAKIRAEQEAKRKEEEAQQAKIRAEQEAKDRAEAEARAKVEAEARAKAEAEAKIRAAEEEKKRAAEEKAERMRQRRERDAEKMTPGTGICAGCDDYITDKNYLESEDDDGKPMFLHSGKPPYPEDYPAGKSCMELFEEGGGVPRCEHCGDWCRGDYVVLTRGSTGEKVNVHQQCVDAYKAAAAAAKK